jgi:hypothetical protein
MKMFAENSPGLSGVIAVLKRCTMRSYLAVTLLPLLVMAGLQTPGSPTTDTFIGNAVMQHANFIPSTGMIGNAPTRHLPGHNFGAINTASSLDSYRPAAVMPFHYTINNGTIINRNSELGPLTGTLNNSLPTRGPGHDYGAIGGD